MLPKLDLPEGIKVELDDEHAYVIEIWRRLPADPARSSEAFERLGHIDTFSGYVVLDDGLRNSTPSRNPQRDVDWLLRQAAAPRGPDGRAVGHPRG